MKDSGIAWIGEIPKGWVRAKYRYSGVFTKGKLPNEQNIECLGKPIIGASEMLGKECRNFSLDTNIPTCKKQDVLILWDGANAGIVANNCDGIVSSTVVKYECTDENFDSQFLFYLFKNGEHFFKSKVNGTTIPHMNQKYIDEYLCIQPPLLEQQKIAEFLDRKCGEIDEMISLQEKVIEELKAYKQSIITEAVTKGLNPNVAMRDSGVAWIGEIPEYWELRRAKSMFKQSTSKGNDRLVLLSATQNRGVVDKSTLDSVVQVSENADLSTFKTVHKNDFVISLRSFQGGFEISHEEGVISPAYTVFRLSTQTYPHYYRHLFKSYGFIDKINSLTVGIREGKNIQYVDFADMLLPYIPLAEQQKIAEFLDRKCDEIDRLIEIKGKKIEELKEYKKSLIYEYVTGKKEI
jgi:type I restriction enzyme S subunit